MKERNQLATKILSMILIVVFIFPIIVPLKSNATGLTVTLDTNDTQIKAGQKICVNVYVTGDSIASFTCYPSFDKNIFNDISSSSLVVPSGLKDQGNGSWKASYSSSNNKITVEENDGSYFTIPNGGLLFSINLVAKIDTSTTTIKLKTVESDGENDYYSIAEVSGTIPKAAPATYSITYNQNTADIVNNMPSAGQKTHGTNYTIPSTVPTRTGYTFAGWTTNSSGTGTNYSAGGSYTIDADTTFYAKWTAKQTTLTVNPNGGTWDGSSSTQTFTQNYNSTKTINNPTRTPNGHTVRFNTNGGTSTDSLQQVQTTVFTGWNKTGGGSLSSTTYTFGDSNGTLTAQYEGQAITLPNATKTGATLKGWFTAQTGGTPVGGAGTSWTPSSDTTLFAQWNEVDYTLTVNPNGGTWKGSTATQNVTGNYTSTTTVPNPTAPNGYEVTLNNDGTTSTVTQTKTFTAWTLSGKGRIDGTTYTFGDGNGTLTAQYTPNSVTLSTPTKPGYTFDGWYTASTGGNKVTSPYTPTNNVTLYARWTANKYTITFDGNGVAVTPSTKQVTYGQTYGTLPAPTKPGYTFNGWYNGGNKVQSTDTVDITGNTTLTAQWLGAEYTVYFNPDGGNVSPTSKKVNNEGQYGALPTPTKTGYTFAGWYKDGTKIESTTKVETTTDITLKAKWTAIKSTLTVNPNGGIWDGSSSSQTFTQDYNTTKTINNPSKNIDGCRVTFDGNGGTAQTVAITQTTTFTGWTPSGKGSFGGTTYTFGDGNGTLTANYSGENITLPNATKTGATLKGWYTSTTGGTPVGGAGDIWKPSTDITLYAQWNETNYILTVDPNGGTWNGSSAQQTVTGTYNEQKQIPNPTAPNGYIVTLNNDGTTTQITQTKTFTVWKQSGKGSINGTTYTFGDGNGTITAQYTENNVTLPTPTKTGYTFDGWYTASTGGNKVTSPYTPTNDITLYARWTANQYRITFDADGGNVTPSTKQVTYDQKYGELPTPTKTGYTFEGWFMDDSTQITSNDTVKITEDKTLKAHWQGATYTLTVNPNGGTWNGSSAQQTVTGTYNATKTIANPTAPSGYTVTLNNDGTTTQITQTKTFTGWTSSGKGSISDTTYTFGDGDGTITAQYKDDDVTLPEPTKTGYTFDGWYTAATGGDKVNTSYKPTNNITLYARWTANKYKVTFDGNGATGIPTSKDVTYGEKYGELPTPTKDGYEFDGWYKEDGTKVTEDDIVDITEETKLTAGWLGAEYTVNFDADGGNTSVTSKKVKNGGKYGELPTPTKEGYTFVGWYDTENNKIESTTTANISSDVTLKAKYEKNKYNVTFKNDDGSTLYTTVVQYEDKAEFSGKEPTSTKNTPGYKAKFKGWSNQPALDKVTGDTTVTATYELSPIQYKISYNNTKDCDNSQNPTSYTIEDKNITLKNLEDKENSKFLGWYDKAVGGNKITSIDTSKLENIILYAQWEKDELYLKSEKYKIGENDIDNYEQGDIYLDKIEPNTTLKDFIANCDTNGDITVINSEGKELSDDDLVGTGMTMKVKRYDEEITLTLVVMGDLDGDGKVTAVDLSTLNQAILKTTKLENAEFKAADLDDSKKITATDLSTINDTILGNITLTYNKNQQNNTSITSL